MKLKLIPKFKNPFDWKSLYSLEPPKDEDKFDEGWQEDIENRRAAFSQINEHLLGLRQSSLEKSDELIIALSSAFLALSIGFVKEIVPLERSILMPVLVVSWISFFAATAVNFFSHTLARQANENQIECARLYYLEGRSKYVNPEINKATRATELWNRWAAGLLMAGLVLTLVFVSVNVLREQSYQTDKANKPVPNQSAPLPNSAGPSSS